MTVGERIAETRNRAGLSQVSLADKINVSKQTLYKYENNIITNIPSDKIERIAKVLNVSPPYLMGWEDPASLIKEDPFDYFLEMQLDLLGYKIIYDEEDGYVILKYHGTEYEIIDDLKDLSSSVKSYINFKLHEIMKHSRIIGAKRKTGQFADNETYLKVNAAHERTDIKVTNQMKKHDDDIMNDDSEWE